MGGAVPAGERGPGTELAQRGLRSLPAQLSSPGAAAAAIAAACGRGRNRGVCSLGGVRWRGVDWAGGVQIEERRMAQRQRRRAILLVVTVMWDDLAAGSRSKPESHPVAFALRRAYPGAALVRVARRAGARAQIWEYDAFVIYEGMRDPARFRLTKAGSAWCYCWAQGGRVTPGTIAARAGGPAWAHAQIGDPRGAPACGTPRAGVEVPEPGEGLWGDAVLQEALGLAPLEREPSGKVMLGKREWPTKEG